MYYPNYVRIEYVKPTHSPGAVKATLMTDGELEREDNRRWYRHPVPLDTLETSDEGSK